MNLLSTGTEKLGEDIFGSTTMCPNWTNTKYPFSSHPLNTPEKSLHDRFYHGHIYIWKNEPQGVRYKYLEVPSGDGLCI